MDNTDQDALYDVEISATIKHRKSKKQSNLTITGSSENEIFPDEILKSLGKIGINGKYRIDKDL